MRKFAVEALETFHREAVSALSEGAQDAGQPLVDDYVLQLGDLAFQAGDLGAAQRRVNAVVGIL